MELEKDSLARHITANTSEGRLARQYEAIERRTKHRTAARPWLRFSPLRVPRSAALAAACAGALVLFMVLRSHDAPVLAPLEGTSVETLATGETILLPDGTRMVLAPQSHLTLATIHGDDVRLVLDRGAVDLDVTRVENRRFVVSAGGYEVTVVGTRFGVRLIQKGAQTVLEVEVARGRVQVSGHGLSESRLLDKGEKWSTTLDGLLTMPSEPPAVPTAPPTSSVPEVPLPASPMASASADPGIVAPKRPAASSEDPKDLLQRALDARAAGHAREAADTLDTLRKRHRKDPRAGLAAFELGRIRLDSLSDPTGAAEAFADAIALAPGAPFREDAEGRRVQALERMGDNGRCSEAKSAYLARYPQGIHRVEVSRSCGGR